MRVRTRRSFDQWLFRWTLRLMEWHVGRLVRRAKKLDQLIREADHPAVVEYYAAYRQDVYQRLIAAQKKLKEAQHFYVNTFIVRFRVGEQ